MASVGSQDVENIKGNVNVLFLLSQTDIKKISISNTLNGQPIDVPFVYSPKNTGNSFYWNILTENFTKWGGAVGPVSWNSPTLGLSGSHAHRWVACLNMRRFEYTSDLVFADKLSGASPHQFIPETFKIYGSEEGYYPNGDNLTNLQLLVKDVHYSIAYNSDFTEYTLTIFPPETPMAYRLEYSTTAPMDNSEVANTISATHEGEPIPIATGYSATEVTIKRNSTSGSSGDIGIDASNRVVLYKVDSETGVRLQGVKFKLVPSPNPNNIEHILVTDSNGRAGSPILANGTYEITEIETIFGYQLNAAPFSIVVGSSGVIRTIKNTKALTKINVHKEWFDGNNQDGIRLQQIEIKIFENYRSASDVREVKTLYQSVILNETNQWSFSLSDIPLYKTTGERVEYTAEEVRVPGYDSGLIADNQNGQINFNFKNSHTPKTVNLTWENIGTIKIISMVIALQMMLIRLL